MLRRKNRWKIMVSDNGEERSGGSRKVVLVGARYGWRLETDRQTQSPIRLREGGTKTGFSRGYNELRVSTKLCTAGKSEGKWGVELTANTHTHTHGDRIQVCVCAFRSNRTDTRTRFHAHTPAHRRLGKPGLVVQRINTPSNPKCVTSLALSVEY